jgi:hypothetical protein
MKTFTHSENTGIQVNDWIKLRHWSNFYKVLSCQPCSDECNGCQQPFRLTLQGARGRENDTWRHCYKEDERWEIQGIRELINE